jgi:hypothetical protein
MLLMRRKSLGRCGYIYAPISTFFHFFYFYFFSSLLNGFEELRVKFLQIFRQAYITRDGNTCRLYREEKWGAQK